MAFASPIQLLLRRFLPIVYFVFTSISCFGATAFLTVLSTPYDRQMIRVFPVLSSADMQRPDSISSLGVSHLMMQLRNMPYEYSSRWQTPAEVDFAQAADCKGKAVALYAQMRRNGARNVRVVIGKRHIFDSGTHAWVEWQTKEGSYMLDPTFNDMPTRTAEFGSATYVPLYAYDGAHKYRANSVAPSATVATRIYVPARYASTLTRPALAGVGPRPTVSATPARTLATQHRQSYSQRTVSTVRRSSSNVAPRPTVSATPVRVASTQHLQTNAQRTVSTARYLSSNVGSKPSVSATPVRIATTQRLQANIPRTVSTARRSSSNFGGVSKTLATTSKAKSVVSTHRKVAVAQKGRVRHRGHVVAKAARHRHVQGPIISQNERFVIPMDPTRLPR